MDERRAPDHARRDSPDKGGRGAGSHEGDEESEASASTSSHKFRRLDQEGSRSRADPEQVNRFLFVDSSAAGQRPRSDQRAINAHIQQNAYRNRRQAAQRQGGTDAANIGRYRREAQIQPRPIEPHPAAEPQRPTLPTLERATPPTTPVSFSPSSTAVSPPPSLDPDQVGRLRHYSNVRAREVREAVNAQRTDEQQITSESRRSISPEDDRALVESSSVRSMLTQILQRLDAGHVGHPLQGSPSSTLMALDSFNLSSVTITPAMNAVLRHCRCPCTSQCPRSN